MEKQMIRVHRVGAVTFGMVLVITGVLFLARLFFPKMDYGMILHFWPVTLIALGVEVLNGSRWKDFEVRGEKGEVIERSRVIYDVPAILLTIVLVLFTIFMGMLDYACSYPGTIFF